MHNYRSVSSSAAKRSMKMSLQLPASLMNNSIGKRVFLASI